MRSSLLSGCCVLLLGAATVHAEPVTIGSGDFTAAATRNSYSTTLDELDIWLTGLTGPAAGSAISSLEGTWSASAGTISLDRSSTLWKGCTLNTYGVAPDSWINFDSLDGGKPWARTGSGADYSRFTGSWYTANPNRNLAYPDPNPGDGFDNTLLARLYVTRGAGLSYSGTLGFTYGGGTIESVNFSLPAVPNPVYPSLMLSPTYADLRIVAGSPAALPVSAPIMVQSPGNVPATFTLGHSTNLSVTPQSGTVAAGATVASPSSFTFTWSDMSIGAKKGSISLPNPCNPAQQSRMAISGAVLADRVLAAAPVGTDDQPARILTGAPYVTTITSGTDRVLDGDKGATRVTTVLSSTAFDDTVAVAFAGNVPAQFNRPNQKAKLALTLPEAPGDYSGAIDLAHPTRGTSMLANGEAPSAGASVQPAMLSYNVTVLEPRQLSIEDHWATLNVLRGAIVSGTLATFTVDTLNADPDYATNVYVGGNNGSILGKFTVPQTLINDGSVSMPLIGTVDTSKYGVTTRSNSLPVTTAEAKSVQDKTKYPSLRVGCTTNVGVASFGFAPTAFDSGETVLSAAAAAGTRMSYLSSQVNPKGTLAGDRTPAANIGSLKADVHGAVGTEAVIVDSTPVSADTTVSMQWRQRLPGEAGLPPLDPALPPGKPWLASDVVKIQGVGADVSYALQLSFDNRIDIALGGLGYADVTQQWQKLFVAQLSLDGSHWQQPGGAGHLESLTDFLTAPGNVGRSLADLVGNWGVDPATSTTGLGHSWIIVAGGQSGIFAVDPGLSDALRPVPEPATLVLLVAVVPAIAVALGRRRMR